MGRFQEPRWLRATDADRRRRIMLQGCPLFGALLILAFGLVPIAGPRGQAAALTPAEAPEPATGTGAEMPARAAAPALPRASSAYVPQSVAVQATRPPAQIAVPPPCDGPRRPEACIQPRPPVPPRPPAQRSLPLTPPPVAPPAAHA